MVGHERYDVNEASKKELAQIPGVDDSTVGAIVKFREQRGRIHNVEELTDIEEIEPEEMDQLREWLTVASDQSGSLDYEGKHEEPEIV